MAGSKTPAVLYHTVNGWATEGKRFCRQTRLITWVGKPILHGHAPRVWKCVCSLDYLFILFDSGAMFLCWIIESTPYLVRTLAPCPLFKISKICGVSLPGVDSPLGSFTKHEMDQATAMLREGGRRKERAWGRREGEKWKDVMGSSVSEEEVLSLPPEASSFPLLWEPGGLRRTRLWGRSLEVITGEDGVCVFL